MLTLLIALTSAQAGVPVPSVDGDQAITCADGTSFSTIVQASRPTGKAGSTLHDVMARKFVDVTQPIWAVSSKRHNALRAISFSMAPNVDPTIVAQALPEDGIYTLDRSRIHFEWPTRTPVPGGVVEVIESFKAPNGCVMAQSGDPAQTGGFWVQEGGERVEARLPQQVLEKTMDRMGIPQAAHVRANIPLDASTAEPVAVAMRVNVELSTLQLNEWLVLSKVAEPLTLDLPLVPGAQIALVGTPSNPGLVGSVRLTSKKDAKQLYKALTSGDAKPDDKPLLAAMDGPRVFFATSSTLLSDVQQPAAGTPWFPADSHTPSTPASDPGVFVRLRNGEEVMAFAIVTNAAGHMLMVAEGPQATQIMRSL